MRPDSKDAILANWYGEDKNFGDLITPYLLRQFTGREPINLLHVHRGRNPLKQNPLLRETWSSLRQRTRRERLPEYVLVGSILGWGTWAPDVQVIWGAGFMDEAVRLQKRPRHIHAVRGEKSLAQLPAEWRTDISTLGDPGILVGDMVAPTRNRSGKIGVVAHYIHKSAPLLAALAGHPDITVIDIQQDVEPFIRQIAACDVIVASAMHGLIAADGLGLPTRWVRLPEMTMPAGGHFKFLDYFSVAGQPQETPDLVETPADVLAAARRAITRDVAAAKRQLLAASPFIGFASAAA